MEHFLTIKPRWGWGRGRAVVGGLVWISLFSLRMGDSPETGLIQRIVLLGILVVVPLGLSLVPGANSEERDVRLYHLALLAQPFGAIAAVASFLLTPGVPAAALASLWFVVTALIALLGLSRLSKPELRSAAEISISAGLIYVPVAGSWLIVSRLGVQLLGYGDTIILLTAVHFHFAAYAAPILSGLAGRKLSEKVNLNRAFKLVPLGIIAGTPLVAAGITFSPVIALIGTVMISVALLILSVLVVGWILPSTQSIPARILLLVSSASTLPAMVLACAYAYSIVFHKLIIDIPQMALTHGLINAFGFALCGLAAWALIESKDTESQRRKGS
ncbi:MAG TPA: YndJ family protein [Pyrinomonadaceae bacterium]|nr:YndJ family protein [Pyrinomonadaceae bacterium]